jgi:hypothetical protein
MREIKSRGEIEKKENKNKTRMGIVLAALLLMSTAGYALLNRDSTSTSDGTQVNGATDTGEVIDFKGTKFIAQTNGLYRFNVKNIEGTFYSSYTPNDVAGINVPFVTLAALQGQAVYYSGNILAIQEILGNINPFILRTQEACPAIGNPVCDEELPVKDCTNNFIIVNDGKEGGARVRADGKCMIIESDASELLKTADALLFRLLGIN